MIDLLVVPGDGKDTSGHVAKSLESTNGEIESVIIPKSYRKAVSKWVPTEMKVPIELTKSLRIQGTYQQRWP